MDNSVPIWRLVVAGIISCTIALSGWTLQAVANMPKEYTTKQEFNELRKENRQDHKEILREIQQLRRGE